MQKLHQLNPKEIIVDEGRARKEFKKSPLYQLEEDIKRNGQLQPGVCRIGEDGTYHLILGERRLRACNQIGIDFTFILREEVDDPVKLKEIELSENLCREDLSWQEEVQAKAELHALKQKLYGTTSPGKRGGHSLADTAGELGETKGLLSKDIELAMWAESLPEVREAKTKTEAKKIVKRIKEQLERGELFEKALVTLGEPSDALVPEAIKAMAVIDPNLDIKDYSLLQQKIARFDRQIIHGTLEENTSIFKDGSVDLVLFDPPWAVGFDQVRLDLGSTKSYSDDIQENLKKLPLWLQILYTKMSPNSPLYMFFGIVNHDVVYNTLEAINFTTNRIPIIWHKLGAHRTRNPKIWPGRSYEPIAFARKGNRSLVYEGKPDVVTTNPPTPRIKKDHPSAKYPDIYIDLIQRSALPGDTVLDPMCGSGMSLVACDFLEPTLKLDWWGIEKDQDFRELSIANLVQGYHEIILINPSSSKYSQSLIEESLSEDFRTHEPGSPDWKRYWNTYPEKQEEMLAWGKEKK